MDVKFSCTDCQQHIAIDESCAGRWLKCPACGKIVKVPGERKESISAEIIRSIPAKPEIITPATPTVRKPLHPMQRLLAGWALGAALLGLFVLGLHLSAWASLPKNFNARLNEIYKNGEIRDAAVVNQDNTQLVYARNVEKGVGIFLVDLVSLKHKEIAAAEGADTAKGRAFSLFGWSPDNRHMAFSTVESGPQNKHVVVCQGGNGTVEKTFDTPNALECGAWLSANSLVLLDRSHKLYIYNLEEDRSFEKMGKRGLNEIRQLDNHGATYELTAVSDHAVAYVDKGNIWKLDVPTAWASQITHLTNAVIEWVDYTPGTDEYLFCLGNGGEGENRRLFRFNPHSGEQGQLLPLTEANLVAFKGQWLKDGKGYSYVGAEQTRSYFAVVGTAENPTNVFLGQRMRSYSLSPKRNKAYLVATGGRSPLGIWEYDIEAKALRNVVPPREISPLFTIIDPVQASVIRPDGARVDYYTLPPPNMVPGKKYPAVIEPYSDSRFQENFQFMANSGIYFASVNRFGLASLDSIETAHDDALAVYRELVKNPNIDPHRIYLVGNSRATIALSQLIREHPDYWRGAIFCSPITFPEMPPHVGAYPSIFISEGDEDEVSRQQASEVFAEESRRHRVPLQILYSHSNHDFGSASLMRDRYGRVVRFILEGF
jgi:predicted esterase